MGPWKYSVPILFALLIAGCKSPFDRTRDASNGGGTQTFSTTSTLVVFGNELTTGGGAFEFPGAEGQTLSFSDMSDPIIGRRSIRYSWTGEKVTNLGCPAQSPSNFAGFDLQHAVNLSDYTAPGRDLSKAGYHNVTFWARGSLSTNTVLKVEAASIGAIADPCHPPDSACLTLSVNGHVADDVCSTPGFGANPFTKLPPGPLTTAWNKYTIPLADPNPLTSVGDIRDFFKATFVFTPPPTGAPSGQGGEVFFDQIQYEP